MGIQTYYNGLVLVDNNGQRGTNNFYAQYPYRIQYGKKHIFDVWYCGNPDCLHRIFKTWVACPYCGQKVTWPEKNGGKKDARSVNQHQAGVGRKNPEP